MNIVELKSKIILNKLPNFLIFTGTEIGVIKVYLKGITQKNKLPLTKVDSVESAIKLCSGKSFFNKRKIFWVVDDNDFITQENSWPKIKEILKDNILILYYHYSDNRLSFWKTFKEDVVVFEPMKVEVLAKQLNLDSGLCISNCIKLISLCGNDYTKCMLEIDKIRNISKAKNISIDMAFESNLDIVCSSFDVNIFNFVDSVLTRDYKSIFYLYNILKTNNEPQIKLISLLYNGFKNVLIAQTIFNTKNIKQNTGIDYYIYKKAKDKSGHYSNEEIEFLLYTLTQIDQGIKLGNIDSDIAIDYFLKNI